MLCMMYTGYVTPKQNPRGAQVGTTLPYKNVNKSLNSELWNALMLLLTLLRSLISTVMDLEASL